MSKKIKTHAIYIAIIIALVGTVTLMSKQLATTDYVASTPNCPDLEAEIRSMDQEEINSLMIITAEVLTAHFKEETREQVEEEHTRYANRLALEHMNEVMGVLVKSIGAMPTSTIAVTE